MDSPRRTLDANLAVEQETRSLYPEVRQHRLQANGRMPKSMSDDLIEGKEVHADFPSDPPV